MYEQLIIIFILLGIFTVLHTIAFVMIFKIKRSDDSSPKAYSKQDRQIKSHASGVVLCRNCLAKYGAQNEVCPKCGTPWRN